MANGWLQIAERLKIPFGLQRWPENKSPHPATVVQLIEARTEQPPMWRSCISKRPPAFLNPLDEIAQIVNASMVAVSSSMR